MNQLRIALVVGAAGLLIGSSCFAQAKKELTPQQQRMSECAHEGKGKKGDDYKQFMKECLKTKKGASPATAAKPAAATTMPAASAVATTAKQAPSQKDKMKSCNAQAKEKSLKGDARKTFMSECLKG